MSTMKGTAVPVKAEVDAYTLAYLAGAIDADGSFTIHVNKTRHNQDPIRFSPQYHEKISLKQVTPQVPHLLYETFGGCLYLQGPSITKGRPLWVWHVDCARAAHAARLLLPHLRIKIEQAKLLLMLRSRKNACSDRFTGLSRPVPAGRRVPDSEIVAREEIRAKVRALNKVGVPA
jgi:hypothetical protein